MLSIFDVFSIGIGPSSSHTVGPMLAAKNFSDLVAERCLHRATRLQIDIYGSLALTGAGHGTMSAILSGLEGNEPETVDTKRLMQRFTELQNNENLLIGGVHPIPFTYATDMRIHKDKVLPLHSNGMVLSVFGEDGEQLLQETYYSVGGGTIKTERNFNEPTPPPADPPYTFTSWQELATIATEHNLSIAEVILANELAWRTESEVTALLDSFFDVMRHSIEQGCIAEGYLPGSLGVKRRAPNLLRKIAAKQATGFGQLLPWPMLYAFAVAEENATGGRIVTAPTNGSAGIIPAVLFYHKNFMPNATKKEIHDFMLVAGAIGILYKSNASVSGAEVGCQGEVGVACSMAAGALCAVLGGSTEQIAAAAEMGMEHNLGLTCDPIGGLVQVPCIERNAYAAERAISCAQLALLEDGKGYIVSLDQIIEVMYKTGLDMQAKYKETSLGGLAITIAQKEC